MSTTDAPGHGQRHDHENSLWSGGWAYWSLVYADRRLNRTIEHGKPMQRTVDGITMASISHVERSTLQPCATRRVTDQTHVQSCHKLWN